MAQIFYSTVDFRSTRDEKFKFLEKAKNVYGVDWQEINPNKNYVWLTDGMEDDWESMISIGNKEAKAGKGISIFKNYSNGISTNRDSWAYNFNFQNLANNMAKTIEFYQNQLVSYLITSSNMSVDDFVMNDDTKISWSSHLKECFARKIQTKFEKDKIISSIYRPFSKRFLYFDKVWTHRRFQFQYFFPKESENIVICCSGISSNQPFQTLSVNMIPCLDFIEKSQCFPFYTYDEDGTNRKENISDWSLDEFQKQYKDEKITKWDIFYYIYGVLHKHEYREKYAANLKRELPRIPYYDDFWKYSSAGKKLADLHVNYETQEEYYLEKIESPGKQLDYKVEKMKYNKDKTAIIYNDFLTLSGIPIEAHNYKLGNRSALDWIVDQYQVKTDKRSGITNDPNRLDEPDYIIKLIGKIVTVSVETVRIVEGLRGNE